jgi:hypothetical protein
MFRQKTEQTLETPAPYMPAFSLRVVPGNGGKRTIIFCRPSNIPLLLSHVLILGKEGFQLQLAFGQQEAKDSIPAFENCLAGRAD